jgi:hypothetical protein
VAVGFAGAEGAIFTSTNSCILWQRSHRLDMPSMVVYFYYAFIPGGDMNRFIFGVIAIATISTGASASEAAVKALPPPPAPFAGASANVGSVWVKDQIADLDRLDAIQRYSLRDSGSVGSGVLGYNFQYRQFACIKVGHRLTC